MAADEPLYLSQAAADAQLALAGLSDEELSWELQTRAVQLALRMHTTPKEVLQDASNASMGPDDSTWPGLRIAVRQALKAAGVSVPDWGANETSETEGTVDVIAIAGEIHHQLVAAAPDGPGMKLIDREFITGLIRQRVAFEAGVIDPSGLSAFTDIQNLQAQIERASHRREAKALNQELEQAGRRFNTEVERAIEENNLGAVVDSIASLILTEDLTEALRNK